MRSQECTACSGTGRNVVPLARLLLDAVDSQLARDQLHAYADHLCNNGNPIGELLHYVLTFWMKPLTVDERDVTPDSVDMSLAHTGEALRWLEWLTWHRWFDQQRNCAPSDFIVEVEGFQYSYVGPHPESVTAQEIVDAFNAQGGPVSFTTDVAGSDITFVVHGRSPQTIGIVPRPRARSSLRRNLQAPHIGDRLGRRLGVRR